MIGMCIVFLLFASLMVYSFSVQTVYNPYTQKLDYVSDGNFSDVNSTLSVVNITDSLSLDGRNITNVDCIHFISGGQICNSP